MSVSNSTNVQLKIGSKNSSLSSLSVQDGSLIAKETNDTNFKLYLDNNIRKELTTTSADSLSTARSITLSEAVTSYPTNFDGNANISIPVTGVKEAYLQWGGRNLAASFGPIDASMIPQLGANRFAFMPLAGVEYQYSKDNGATWSEYSTSSENKINLFNGNGGNFSIGRADTIKNVDKSQYQFRVIITTDLAKVYTTLRKFCIFCSTNGSNGCWCTIDAKTKANVDSGTNTWEVFADKVPIAGWSGYNIINTEDITTYYNSSDQYQELRFTFGVTSHPSSNNYSGLAIISIMGFGGVGWHTPSNLAKNGSIYIYDYQQNAIFPAGVTATSVNATSVTATFYGTLYGNAETATVATKIARGGNISAQMTFNWDLKTEQPTRVWGGNENDATQMYVYDPRNFSVANASKLGNVDASEYALKTDVENKWETY